MPTTNHKSTRGKISDSIITGKSTKGVGGPSKTPKKPEIIKVNSKQGNGDTAVNTEQLKMPIEVEQAELSATEVQAVVVDEEDSSTPSRLGNNNQVSKEVKKTDPISEWLQQPAGSAAARKDPKKPDNNKLTRFNTSFAVSEAVQKLVFELREGCYPLASPNQLEKKPFERDQEPPEEARLARLVWDAVYVCGSILKFAKGCKLSRTTVRAIATGVTIEPDNRTLDNIASYLDKALNIINPDSGKPYTWQELDDMARCYARGLEGEGNYRRNKLVDELMAENDRLRQKVEEMTRQAQEMENKVYLLQQQVQEKIKLFQSRDKQREEERKQEAEQVKRMEEELALVIGEFKSGDKPGDRELTPTI